MLISLTINMRVGFTGTRTGMTDTQSDVVKALLQKLWVPEVENWFHHGACVGADEEAAQIARELGYKLHGHPPTNTRKMSSIVSDASSEPKGYLSRNRDIVDTCRILIAAPEMMRERMTGSVSGTWYTWRYAGKNNKPRTMVFPNGWSSTA